MSKNKLIVIISFCVLFVGQSACQDSWKDYQLPDRDDTSDYRPTGLKPEDNEANLRKGNESLPANREDKKTETTDDPVLDYKSFKEILAEIHNNTNMLRVERELSRLEKAYNGSLFLMRETAVIKRARYYKSEDGILWLKSPNGVEAKLIIPNEKAEAYERIKEYDFITTLVRLKGMEKDAFAFELVELKDISPFDDDLGLDDMVEYNRVIEKLVQSEPVPESKKESDADNRNRKNDDGEKIVEDKYFIQKARREYLEEANFMKLGYLDGILKSVRENRGQIYMILQVGSTEVKIEFQERYRRLLELLEPGSSLRVFCRAASFDAYEMPLFKYGYIFVE